LPKWNDDNSSLILILFRLDHYALSLSCTPTQNDPVCSILSGWTTTTGRLLGSLGVLT